MAEEVLGFVIRGSLGGSPFPPPSSSLESDSEELRFLSIRASPAGREAVKPICGAAHSGRPTDSAESDTGEAVMARRGSDLPKVREQAAEEPEKEAEPLGPEGRTLTLFTHIVTQMLRSKAST